MHRCWKPVTEQEELPSAPAAERNFLPILGVLKLEFRDASRVIEIGAGTGQHAVGFAGAMPWLSWLPTDRPENIAAIDRWVRAVEIDNVEEPASFDVSRDEPPAGPFDAAFSANTAHIMDVASVREMFALTGSVLEAGGRFCLYGPFREGGNFSTESNARFDGHLRATDSSMGIRDLEAIDADAQSAGLRRIRRFAMPGNNLILVFERDNQRECL